jgi:CheY-like chemotaxis protein
MTQPAAMRLRILVADDLQDNADSLAVLLREHGHEVRTVHNGGDAVVAAAAMRPHVALLDIAMPGLDGYEVCRCLRAQNWGRKMFIVAQTAWGREMDLDRARSAGFDMHMQKPVNTEALLMHLEKFRRSESGNKSGEGTSRAALPDQGQ